MKPAPAHPTPDEDLIALVKAIAVDMARADHARDKAEKALAVRRRDREDSDQWK